MDKHAVTNVPLLFLCLILIVALAIFSYLKRDSGKWYLYLVILVALETVSILYLAFL
ncbi:MAG: hypothetical protein Q8916_00865 [Bacteroidota bacterium]|nr:hypothetical protein [Bacteroidota bacterium]MDP4228937.1 hypothetical protein [Bacteroidota bacterium]MDP4236698.1 hypothetical protein [Bacteroidota bacterium]